MFKKKLKDVLFIDIDLIRDSKKFSFIKDENLKTNISIVAQNITFLYSLVKSYDLPGPITYSTNKTIIIYIASMIEALLIYGIKSKISLEDIKESKIKKVKDKKLIHRLDKKSRIIWGKEIESCKDWSNLSLQDLNRIAKREEIIDKDFFLECEDLRKKRNKIHISSLKNEDDFIESTDLEKALWLLGEIISKINLLEKNK